MACDKYLIIPSEDGTYAFTMKHSDENDIFGAVVYLSKSEIKELIQDLLKCLKTK